MHNWPLVTVAISDKQYIVYTIHKYIMEQRGNWQDRAGFNSINKYHVMAL